MPRRWYCYGMWAATSPIEKLRLHFANEIVTQNTKQNPNRKESEIFSRSSEQSWWWWHLTFLSSSLFVFFRIKQLQTEKTNNIQSNEKKNSDQFDFEGRWPNSQKLVMLLHVQRPFSIFFLFQLSWPIKGFLTTMLETFVSCVDVYTIIINY